mmetsp:Transcript_10082/g.24665  ORF Transcript_10082/g.24665 Transcript_10082/m.24665 type:complete len:282 (-) Transcript_10082:33-878(-)
MRSHSRCPRDVCSEGATKVQLVAEHVRDKRQRRVNRREGRHHLAVVWRDHALQRRHGAGHLGLGHKRHDAKHREAAVVDLRQEAPRLLLRRHLRLQAKGVEEVERHRVRHASVGELGVLARHAARHVVRLDALAEQLKEANEAQDLQLRRRGERVPLRRGRRDLGNRRVRQVRLQVPREVDAVRAHDEADKRGHRDAAMLDLGMTQPADRLLLRKRLVRARRERKRIVEAHDRVELLGELLEVSSGLHHGRRAALRRVHRHSGRRERRGGREERQHGGKAG